MPTPGAWLDLRGVVHVHGEASHDSHGTLEEIARAARSADVRWVALTDHPDRERPVQRGGRSAGVTILPGYELNAAGGTLLALGVSQPPPRGLEPDAQVRWIHEHGGLAFVGHFEQSGLAQREAYRRAAPDGIEVANLHAQAAGRRLRTALSLLLLPAPLALQTLLYAPEGNLERWERLPEARTIVGGVDAHARFRLLGPLGGTFDRYRDLFGLLTTHVLARDDSPEAILDALRAGRSYVAFEGLGRVDAFEFAAERGGFRLRAPRDCQLALHCDGRAVAAARGPEAWLAAPPGASRCRASAWLDGRLWLLTSVQAAP